MSGDNRTSGDLSGALRQLVAGECQKYLNVRQVAEALGVCVKTVRRLHTDGHLRCFRLGYRTVRYSDSDVALFLRSRMSVVEGGKSEETMPQPKTAEHWRGQGYKLSPIPSKCPACQAVVDVWSKPGRKPGTVSVALADPKTFEPHWATCPNAKQFRTEQNRRAGVL